ncbi:hypothetical protein [Aquamicrobium zhengzhouense]|uniref:Uncharacterized protein n=1 Tax=Aquamicrobium zhengzhouense TaxID=2781738 RepID=A0ABS0S9Y6_9HYPH|nr:hypothetical protein [Aquamicrobium zhengzhouense]MBI1620062.1 hypothetical protein [Aquamicrobium zhengzhouense]
MSVTSFRPRKRKIMQRCPNSDNPNWAEYHEQTDAETPADLERLAARLRTIFPAHEFVIQ